MSPQHAIYLEDVLIEAKDLVNGLTITQAEAVDAVTYFNIDLGSQDVVFAEGAASETFVGDENRALFQNAAEYRARYPDAPWQETIYYAPRHDHGLAVHRARNRIARMAGQAEDRIAASTAMPPRGFVDRVTERVAEGWVQCPDTPEDRVLVEIVMDGIVVGQVLANRYRADLEAAGLGTGRHSFTCTAEAGQALRPDDVVVRRALDGAVLNRSTPQEGSHEVLAATSAPDTAARAPTAPPGPMRGHVDRVAGALIEGWVQDLANPDHGVPIEVLHGGTVVAHGIAGRYRPDLEAAGIGTGRHAYRMELPIPVRAEDITLRRSADQAALPEDPREARIAA